MRAWVGLVSSPGGGGGVLPIMDYTGRFRPKGVPFSGWRYIKGSASKLSRNSEQARLLHNPRQTTETDRGKTRDAEYKVT